MYKSRNIQIFFFVRDVFFISRFFFVLFFRQLFASFRIAFGLSHSRFALRPGLSGISFGGVDRFSVF